MDAKDWPPVSGRAWLQFAARRLARFSVQVEVDSPYPASRDAEAVTISDASGSTILFRDADPSISAVLEELAHALQHESDRFADLDADEMQMRREIEVGECLSERQSRYGIPDHEHTATCELLANYKEKLKNILDRW